MDKKSVNSMLNEISKDINELEDEKNLGKIIKQYNKINNDIKTASNKLSTLTRLFEDDNTLMNNCCEINDEEYDKYIKSFSENEINKIMENDDLEKQIEEYKILQKKINQCKKYLDSRKTNIIECDKKQEIGVEKKENKNISKQVNTKGNKKIFTKKNAIKKITNDKQNIKKKDSSDSSDSSDEERKKIISTSEISDESNAKTSEQSTD
jgi:hypothetical protein